jgi:hypothetical protein
VARRVVFVDIVIAKFYDVRMSELPEQVLFALEKFLDRPVCMEKIEGLF